MNVLYDAFRASMKGSAWKEEPQRFEIDFLTEIIKLSNELENRTYKTTSGSIFIFRERGKARLIHGGRMRDRVVRHAICDTELTPKLKPYLIYNNGASQAGKGISFARENFEKDLHNYWLEHRSNEGYVGFIDFSKFYDNMQHDKLLESICLDKMTMHKKQELSVTFGELLYNGQWYTPLREALSAFVTKTQEHVTGKVRIKLYKGNIIKAGAWSDWSLYSEEIATFGEDHVYNQADSAGFINLWGLPISVQAQVAAKNKKN